MNIHGYTSGIMKEGPRSRFLWSYLDLCSQISEFIIQFKVVHRACNSVELYPEVKLYCWKCKFAEAALIGMYWSRSSHYKYLAYIIAGIKH